MKKVIFPLIILVLLIVAGIGGAGRFGYGPLAHLLYKPPAVEAPTGPKLKTIVLGEFIVPLVSNHAIAQQIGMNLEMDVTPESFDQSQNLLPVLLHEIHMNMLDFLPQHADVHMPANRQALHDHLLVLARDVIGQDAVLDVRVKAFYNH
jgi:hypothetical protein